MAGEASVEASSMQMTSMSAKVWPRRLSRQRGSVSAALYTAVRMVMWGMGRDESIND